MVLWLVPFFVGARIFDHHFLVYMNFEGLCSGTPMLALTATVTDKMRVDIISTLDMNGCKTISVSPNRPNICYCVKDRTNIDTDFDPIIEDLKNNSVHANRVIVYCRSLNMCADLYSHFLYTLGNKSYSPPGSEEISDNRLFGMFHSNTSSHIKEVILDSMTRADGVVRVVFATMALGMGVNFVNLHTIVHYGAPRSLEDYFQESGRAGRDGEPSTSTIYWCPKDAPSRKKIESPHDADSFEVRCYLTNSIECRRYQLLKYFDPSIARMLSRRELNTCCDVCQIIDKK